MAYELTRTNNPAGIPAMLETLGLGKVSRRDAFSIQYKNGLLHGKVTRQDGAIQTVTKSVRGNGFGELTSFDPSQMSREERDHLIRQQNAKGRRQMELAEVFGLSQGRISQIVRHDAR